MDIYTIKDTDIIHNTGVDFTTRSCTDEVHIVQYDNTQPIVAVQLFKDGEIYSLPKGYEANLRFGKKDKTFIYKPVIGSNYDRTVVYFSVDEQMSLLPGDVYPIIELTYGGAVVGSSPIIFIIDKNPIQIGDIESKSDYPAIVERISAAETKATEAQQDAADAKAAAVTSAVLSGTGTNTVTLTTTKGGATSTSSVVVNNVGYATNAGGANTATKATQDASGNVITSYYLPKSNVKSKGSATNPVYFDADGVAKATTYQLNASVPSGAVFTDTKNTAGATNSTSKLYLIGATEQTANPQTYSNGDVYAERGILYSSGVHLKGAITGATVEYYFNPSSGAISYIINSTIYSLQFPTKNGIFALTTDITKSAVGLGDVVNAGRDSTPTANSSNYVTSGGVKSYVDNAVSTMSKLRYQVVTTLPTASASTVGIIYLVADTHGSQDVYDEYITIQSGTTYSWEKLGNTDIDLSDYGKLSGDNTWTGNTAFNNTTDGVFDLNMRNVSIFQSQGAMSFGTFTINSQTLFTSRGITCGLLDATGSYTVTFPSAAGTLALVSDITSAVGNCLTGVGDPGTEDYVEFIYKSGQTVVQSRKSFAALKIKGNGTAASTYYPNTAAALNIAPGTNISVSASSGTITIAGKSDSDIKSLAEAQIGTHAGVDKVGTVVGMKYNRTGGITTKTPDSSGYVSLSMSSTNTILAIDGSYSDFTFSLDTSKLVLANDELILDCGSATSNLF